MTLETLQDILKDKKFWIFTMILVLITVVGIAILVRQTPRETLGTGVEPDIQPAIPDIGVLRVEPLQDKKGISTNPTIVINFKKSIIGKNVQITSSPETLFNQSLSPAGVTLTLTPKESLKPSTKY